MVDASISFSWVRRTQLTETANRLLADAEEGAAVHVPSVWPLELANGLLMGVRRRLITDVERRSAIALISELNVSIDTDAPDLAWTTIYNLALAYSLSIYDAAYLELAMRKQLPLASRDGDLRRAAAQAGVEVR